MKCFYHNDLDGQAAAFAVLHSLSRGELCDCISMAYGKPFPIERVEQGERVFIVDFSIDPLEMLALLAVTEDVVWIDHHKTAIDKYADFPRQLKGIRRDGTAGCVLAWEYCFPNDPLPRAIMLVGDRDVWAWQFGKETADFCAGAHMENTHPHSDFWQMMLAPAGDARSFSLLTMKRVIENGDVVNRYRAKFYADMVKSIGFEADLDGHRCFCMNAARVDSKAFGDAIKEYDFVSSFYFDGKQYTVSLYSEKIDVSEIAKAHGGGGHSGASGYQCAEIPYELTLKAGLA